MMTIHNKINLTFILLLSLGFRCKASDRQEHRLQLSFKDINVVLYKDKIDLSHRLKLKKPDGPTLYGGASFSARNGVKINFDLTLGLNPSLHLQEFTTAIFDQLGLQKEWSLNPSLKVHWFKSNFIEEDTVQLIAQDFISQMEVVLDHLLEDIESDDFTCKEQDIWRFEDLTLGIIFPTQHFDMSKVRRGEPGETKVVGVKLNSKDVDDNIDDIKESSKQSPSPHLKRTSEKPYTIGDMLFGRTSKNSQYKKSVPYDQPAISSLRNLEGEEAISNKLGNEPHPFNKTKEQEENHMRGNYLMSLGNHLKARQ